MYKITGYTDMCENFDYTFNSFVSAVKAFRELDEWCTVFIRRNGETDSCLFVK